MFPAGYVSNASDPAMGPADPNFNDAGPGWSWLALILPYSEETTTAGQLDTRLKCWDAANLAAVALPVPLFRCPSDAPGKIPIPTRPSM